MTQPASHCLVQALDYPWASQGRQVALFKILGPVDRASLSLALPTAGAARKRCLGRTGIWASSQVATEIHLDPGPGTTQPGQPPTTAAGSAALHTHPPTAPS